ncbi:MAG: isoprenyl transferase [Candidatus Loosdrechtia sp.]|uniref:undecaprenyl diphosphate synthase family protein n=1 Tax=Candidatus Loosdrechtia sp. TaxID=3101272 RepID=UPI003A6B074E|nr:MAG: isoprenyl transferase [Candidatus Jettenia sp. AMX2]
MNGSEKIPSHIAIIMDGNGRWAKQKGFARFRGHQEGATSVREITRECAKKNIKQLTLYAFSQENWKRPRREIDLLMKLLKDYLVRERSEIRENDIRLTAIGRISGLPDDVKRELAFSMEESKNNKGMVLCLALNYGGRAEIIDAAREIARDVRTGQLCVDDITEDAFKKYLYTRDMTDPDLLIRTAGEMRISNFLLWEISYTEIWVTPVFWPDFRKEHLEEAIMDYAHRERRFGGLLE